MGGEVNINIQIANMQGEAKELAKAADSDGSGSIDNAYEHSLFTQYCDAAGVDASDYTARYTADDTTKAEKKFVKDQKYSGSVKENAANLEQYEAVWQQAMRTAFEAVGNNPQSRAKLLAFVKGKPKLQNFTSMADYALELGRKIEAMGTLVDKDLKSFVAELTNNSVEAINQHNDQNTTKVVAAIALTADAIMQQLEENKAEIINEVKVSANETMALVKAEGNRIVKVIRNAEGHIVRVVREEGAHTRAHVDYWGALNLEATEYYGNANLQATNDAADKIIENDNNNKDQIIDDAHGNTDKILNGQQEQAVLTAHNEAITRNLNGDGRFVDTGHTQRTITAFNIMANKIISSDLPFDKKEALMKHLERKSADRYIFNEEIRALQDEVEEAINGTTPRSFSERLIDIIRDGANGPRL